jgi:predicted TIM-barrel fold metal-dependent hydrolase
MMKGRLDNLGGVGTLIVDCHVHVWSENDVPVVVNEARRIGLHRICVSCLKDWDWDAAENPGAANSIVFNAASREPEVLGYVYADPRHDFAAEEIDRYSSHPAMIGVKLWIACPANDPCVFPIAEQAARMGLIMLVHSWRRGTRLAKGYQTLPSQVCDLASSFPRVPIIMAHMGGDWEDGLREVADPDNLLVDTSGSIVESGMVEEAVEILGARRVVYGSDAPGVGYMPNIGKVLSAGIGDREKALILGGNMQELIKDRLEKQAR